MRNFYSGCQQGLALGWRNASSYRIPWRTLSRALDWETVLKRVAKLSTLWKTSSTMVGQVISTRLKSEKISTSDQLSFLSRSLSADLISEAAKALQRFWSPSIYSYIKITFVTPGESDSERCEVSKNAFQGFRRHSKPSQATHQH